MRSLGAITKMTPLEAGALRGRAISGDKNAARDYLLYSAWRRISANKLLRPRQKLHALAAMDRLVDVQVVKVDG